MGKDRLNGAAVTWKGVVIILVSLVGIAGTAGFSVIKWGLAAENTVKNIAALEVRHVDDIRKCEAADAELAEDISGIEEKLGALHTEQVLQSAILMRIEKKLP